MNTLNFSIPIHIADFVPTDLESRQKMPKNIACIAKIEEYLALSEVCQYRIEYHEGYIISLGIFFEELMITHEKIVSNFLFLLRIFIKTAKLDWRVYASGLHIYIHSESKPSSYKPDASVFKEEEKSVVYTNPTNNSKQTAQSNPSVALEVLSPSTENFDLTEKLENYKKIASLEQIIFVEQNCFAVILHEKIGSYWVKNEFFSQNDVFFVGDCAISLQDLYENVKFA